MTDFLNNKNVIINTWNYEEYLYCRTGYTFFSDKSRIRFSYTILDVDNNPALREASLQFSKCLGDYHKSGIIKTLKHEFQYKLIELEKENVDLYTEYIQDLKDINEKYNVNIDFTKLPKPIKILPDEYYDIKHELSYLEVSIVIDRNSEIFYLLLDEGFISDYSPVFVNKFYD